MARNKNRLNLALYLRSGPGYHWALYRCPKHEKPGNWGTRYDAKEVTLKPITWRFNEEELTRARAHNVLVRVLLGKVVDNKVFETTIRSIPIRWGRRGYERWTCKAWVQEALRELRTNGALSPSAIVDWNTVQAKGLDYVEHKIEQGR